MHTERAALLEAYAWFELRVPEGIVLDLDPADVPDDWRAQPEPPSTVAIGRSWLDASASALLRVPSAVVPRHHVFLFDPMHADAREVEIGPARPFAFDRRLG